MNVVVDQALANMSNAHKKQIQSLVLNKGLPQARTTIMLFTGLVDMKDIEEILQGIVDWGKDA